MAIIVRPATYHYTTDQCVDRTAKWLINSQNPGIDGVDLRKKLPARKYDLLVSVFNYSTAALIAAAVTPLFLTTIATSVFWGAIAYFIRSTAEQEITSRYAMTPSTELLQRRVRRVDAPLDIAVNVLENIKDNDRFAVDTTWTDNMFIAFNTIVFKAWVPASSHSLQANQ